MWIQQAAGTHQTEFDPLLPEPDSEPLLEPVFDWYSGNDETPARSILQQYLPIAASVLGHLCLLILVRQMITGAEPEPGNFVAQPASIQISFRPRLVPPAATEPAPEPTLQDVLPEQLPAEQAAPELIAEPAIAQSAAEELPVENRADTPASQAPRLVAPALPDLRDVIRNQAQSDAISRGYNNIDCDERQRRNDLIDCGDPDSNAIYDFADAQHNDTAAFFADLNTPAANHNAQPRDATNPDTRANVARDNLTGNLGAGPLIRSVMGQP